jgi:hypothetical protein
MSEDYEDERRERLAERHRADHEAGEGRSLEERYGAQSFGCHEALHTTNLILGLIERELVEHPAILLDAEWYAHVRKAQDELFALYQKIGATHL